MSGQLPSTWEQAAQSYIEELQANPANIATRKASQNALNAYGPLLPELLGGSADLAGSNLTIWSGCKGISADDASGNYIYYGVREFGMSAMMNGLALHGGFKAYGATFLMFMEYARNAVRMAALMKQPAIFVYTHDSIGLGEDGPTHQPVEQLVALRATPNLDNWRPCDQVESAVAWKSLDLIEHVKTMAEGASKLSMAAMGQSEELEGTVTITASEANSAFLLPPVIRKIRTLAPGINIEIVAKNESADLRKREADIAVRHFLPKQPELIMKQVSNSLGNFYATKEFIKINGPFKSLKDLSKANFVGMGDLGSFIEGMKTFGIELSKNNFPIITESHFVHWNLVKEGLAIGIMPHSIGDKDKSVERVLKNYKGINFPTWIVSHRELKTNRRIRFVFDQLVEYFSIV